MRATKEAEKIEAVLGGLTKKNQAQVGLKHTRKNEDQVCLKLMIFKPNNLLEHEFIFPCSLLYSLGTVWPFRFTEP